MTMRTTRPAPLLVRRAAKAVRPYSITERLVGAGEGIRTLDPDLGNKLRASTPQHLFLSRKPLTTYSIRVFSTSPYPCPNLAAPHDFRRRASPLLPRPPPKIRGSSSNSVVIEE